MTRPVPTTCPSEEELEIFAAEDFGHDEHSFDLDDPETIAELGDRIQLLTWIEEHLPECRRCTATVRRLRQKSAAAAFASSYPDLVAVDGPNPIDRNDALAHAVPMSSSELEGELYGPATHEFDEEGGDWRRI